MRFRFLLYALLLSLPLFGGKAGAAASTEPPLFSPSEIMTPDQIRPGMTGYAKSVFQGTKVETYGIKVIGVMRGTFISTEDSDALLPEAIWIRVTSGTVIARKSGIVAGMSGSPVYINGKLIGAIAYGPAFYKEPVGIVTPITHMAEKFAVPQSTSAPHSNRSQSAILTPEPYPSGTVFFPADGTITIDGRKITRAELHYRRPDRAPADKQTAVLTPLATPLMVNGLSPRALKMLGTVLEPYGLIAVPGGGKSPIKTPYKPVPGSSIGVQIAGGDVDLAAFGTVTAVKGNKILAMGHSTFGSGLMDLPMINSYVHDIVPQLEQSYVMASGGAPIGRWSEDRPYALKGFLGEKAHTIPGTFSILDAERGINKKYAVDFCDHRDLTPIYIAVVAQLAADATTISTEGTLSSEFEITAPGLPPYKRQNLYSPSPLEPSDFMSMLLGRGSGSPAREIYQVLDTLMNNPYYPVSPRHISFSAKWQSGTRAAEIIEASSHQRRVRPGETIDIELTLQPWKKPKETRTLQVAIPENVPPGKLQIGLAGGSDGRRLKRRLGIEEPVPVNLPGMLAALARREKNNQLLTEVLLGTTGLEAEGKQLNNLPQVIIEALSAANGRNLRVIRDHAPSLQEMPYVLSGEAVLDFIVETDQKEKAGRAALTGARGGRDFSDSLLREANPELEDGDDEAAGMASAAFLRLSSAEDDLPEGDEAPEMPSFEELDEMTEESGEEEAVVTPRPAASVPAGKISLRKPQFWTDATEKDFAKGKTETTAVNTAGKVELAPPVKEFHRSSEIIWPVAADPTGNLYLGAWFDGKVKAITPAGERLALDTKDTAVTALACDSAGLTYAGAAPSGAVYRITVDGKSSLLGKVPAPYVWALAPQPDASLLAATGPEGKLFRLAPDGKCELLFTAPDRHIIALASAPGGACYFATYPKGKVYRLKDGKISPYYETPPQFTALSLAADSAGNLFIGTSPTAQVIALDSQGKARLFFKAKEKHVFALSPAADGSLYAATGPQARLYRISQNGDSAAVWDDKLGYLVNLTPAPGALHGALADSRRVMTFDLQSSAQGRYLSTVYDAGVPSRWGRLNWQGDLKPGETIALETRSGNTAFPDTAWSDWAAVSADYAGPNIASPQSRYLQYRATLCAAAPAASIPALRQVQVSYLTLNRPPELKLIDPAQETVWSGKKSIKWQATDPDKDNLSYQVFYSADAGATWTEIKEAEKAKATGAPNNPGASEDGPSPASAKSARPKEATAPSPAEERPAPKPTSRAWDTKKVPDGDYLIKVTASDKLSNPKDPLSAEKISAPITLDNSAPLIMLAKSKTPAAPPAKVKLVDGVYVASAEYRVDEGEWHPAFCEDGLYDGPVEYALLEAANLPAGEHTLQIRARDGVGNEAKEEMQYKKSE